jgi:hypothetical protein
MVRARDWVRRFGFREEAGLLAVASRPIGVPSIEERRLLVRIGDVGAHLGKKIQRIEHPEVGLVPWMDRV